MADVEMKYVNKTVTTLRGMEARSVAKWEKEGWELVSQTPAKLLRTTLIFRRPKKPIPKWVWAAVAATVVILGLGITFATIQESNQDHQQAEASPSSSVTPSVQPLPPGTVEPSAGATVAQVTDAEVVATFQSYLADRAANNVMYGKAVSKVTFENRVLRVTFDPAAAGVDQVTFDDLAAHFNFPSFVASPIAFNNDVGNRLRPAIDLIETLEADGTSLGTIDAAGILAFNELSK
jgi:hypothetical protein